MQYYQAFSSFPIIRQQYYKGSEFGTSPLNKKDSNIYVRVFFIKNG